MSQIIILDEWMPITDKFFDDIDSYLVNKQLQRDGPFIHQKINGKQLIWIMVKPICHI